MVRWLGERVKQVCELMCLPCSVGSASILNTNFYSAYHLENGQIGIKIGDSTSAAARRPTGFSKTDRYHRQTRS